MSAHVFNLKVSYYFCQEAKSYGLLGDLIGLHLGSGVDTTSNRSLGGANTLGDFLLPRTAAVSHLQAQGQEPNMDQRLGVLGEVGNRIVAPFFGPLGLAAGGFAEGATQPGANAQQRVVGGIGQGAIEGGGAFLLNKILPFLTSQGVGQQIGNKVEQSVQSGATDTYGDYSNEVRQELARRLGHDEPYQSIVNSRLSAEAPASIAENPTVNARDLLGFRQQAANREPQGIFQMFQGKSPANQVDEIIRDVSSRRLKDLAGTGTLDKIFSTYAKVGSPAKIASTLGVNALLNQLVPEKYRDATMGRGAIGLTILRNLLHL